MRYKDLLFALAQREIQVRYKQSIFGIVWAFLTPLAMTGIFVLIFSHFLKIGSDGTPYPIFAYVAVAPWTLMSGAVPRATESLESNTALIRKIWFPRYLLPMSAILASLVDFAIANIVLFGMMLYYHMPITVFWLYLPMFLMVQIALLYGITLFTSTANAYYRDVKVLVPLAMQVVFYASPIFYSVNAVNGWWKNVYVWNPMVGLLDGYRAILIRGEAPNWSYFGISALVTGVCLIGGWCFFKKMERSLPDVL